MPPSAPPAMHAPLASHAVPGGHEPQLEPEHCPAASHVWPAGHPLHADETHWSDAGSQVSLVGQPVDWQSGAQVKFRQ